MTIGFDAVPLRSGHANRGIGRYLAGILDALVHERPDWCDEHLGCLIAGGQRPVVAKFWRTRRSSFRPQDLDWLTSAVIDRWAIRASPPSVWHMTDPWTPFSMLSAARTIATAYDLIPLLEPTVMAEIRPHRRLIYHRYLKALKESRLVVAISEATAEDVGAHLGIPRDRIHVVYPSIVPPAPGIESAGSLGDPLNLLFVGVLAPHKRPGLALRVLAELTRQGVDADLTFVGTQPPRHREALLRLASDLHVAGKVQLIGRVGDDELVRLYRTTITLAISRVEGFGLPPVEATLAGGRVVATPSRIYDEVLASTATFAASHDPSAIAEAVLTARVRDQRRSMSGALELAVRYAPAKAASSLVAAYEAVLHS